jgi:CTP synthase
MTKFVFVTGGVVSSLGKGIAIASLGAILKDMGYTVSIRKLDPYLNVDPGTMNPIQHGEVFVTDDGGETDLDLGHYERFTGTLAKRTDNITTGRIFQNLLEKERRGDYLGATVQIIPHVTDLIKDFIFTNSADFDFVLCEIGGTVGDIESQPFLEAIRQFSYDVGKEKTMFIHTTLVPYIAAADEMKTKPTQHSVKDLMYHGIEPDIILCRVEKELSASDKKKIALFCNVRERCVIEAPNVDNIYKAPLVYAANGLGLEVLRHFGMGEETAKLQSWKEFITKMENISQVVKIAVVGKYVASKDAYKSLVQALMHAGVYNNVKVEIKWVESRTVNNENVAEVLGDVGGILVPGGFGVDGTQGKIAAIKYARENNVPFFGICFGMQLAVIEFCRNVVGIENADSAELIALDNSPNVEKVINIMTKWQNDNGEFATRAAGGDLGGTMRLGSYESIVLPNTLARKVYGSDRIFERHRHRYEVDIAYKHVIEAKGGIFSSMSPDMCLPEIFEVKNHKFFLGCQFHPELKSQPFAPSKLFCAFVESCK